MPIGFEQRRRPLLVIVAVTYLVVGVSVYGRILDTFFVADDFSYLDAIKTTGTPSIVFSALAERYFRPMVVLVYYMNYQASGMEPWSYHVSVVLLNVVNAWLIFLLARALAPPPRSYQRSLACCFSSSVDTLRRSPGSEGWQIPWSRSLFCLRCCCF